MKKKTIWSIAIIMGLSFVILLGLQLTYMREMANMKKEQFDESVNRALYQASRNLELNETLRFLERDMSSQNSNAGKDSSKVASSTTADADGTNGNQFVTFKLKTMTNKPVNIPKAMILRNDRNSNNAASRSLQELVKNRYVYQRALLDEVVMNMLYSSSDKPLQQRVNFRILDQDIKAELINNGINIPYHFTVSTQDGREVYRCPDYSDEGSEFTYTQTLYRNESPTHMGVLRVHFPDINSYIFSSIRFMIPSVVFTLILLITFIFTIVVIFRQKRYSEMKNDFINNMTHELKTPIASISLAAQMLNDDTVPKTDKMMKHLVGVVSDETKRLRFLVEKVLQMSMFDRKKSSFKKKRLDLNEMVETIANSFTLRVEHTGGKIFVDIEAVDSTIYVDEVNFQNVIFNLMDNAVKYHKPDQPLNVTLKTWNDDKWLYLTVSDNGLGMKKEDLKKIFEKFYRVHTGNVHDVKGFGLGLAYVKKVVDLHDGEIKVDSELGKGTTFTIKLPVIKDD
ncbi:MAG: HAMP domain-containing sensor histidine kinase [Prevotella sp.]|nr:HAMP domain-containing sensor histidine kinase [Prevotella sp.]